MSLNRWKVLACTLTVGVGGLAVFATPPITPKPDQTREPAPLPDLTVKPPSPANGADTQAPVKPVKADEFDLVVPAPIIPAKAEVPVGKPASEPVFESVGPLPMPAIIPVGGDTGDKNPPKKDDVKKAEGDNIPTVSPPKLKPDAPKPDVIKAPEVDFLLPPLPPAGKPESPVKPAPLPPVAPPMAPAKPDPVPPPAAPLKPPVNFDEVPSRLDPLVTPDRPPVAVPPATVPPPPPLTPKTLEPMKSIDPPAVTRPSESTKAPPTARLKMLLRVGDGQPRFEIRNSVTTELLLKVHGEKVEMQAPPETRSSLAGVSAVGRVKFTAPGIEGTCEHLTILSGTGEVLLKGNIHLKTKYGKSWSEMTAEKMVYQIGMSGLTAPGTKPPVTPASYIPD